MTGRVLTNYSRFAFNFLCFLDPSAHKVNREALLSSRSDSSFPSQIGPSVGRFLRNVKVVPRAIQNGSSVGSGPPLEETGIVFQKGFYFASMISQLDTAGCGSLGHCPVLGGAAT